MGQEDSRSRELPHLLRAESHCQLATWMAGIHIHLPRGETENWTGTAEPPSESTLILCAHSAPGIKTEPRDSTVQSLLRSRKFPQAGDIGKGGWKVKKTLKTPFRREPGSVTSAPDLNTLPSAKFHQGDQAKKTVTASIILR